jgi:hypothetical protein
MARRPSKADKKFISAWLEARESVSRYFILSENSPAVKTPTTKKRKTARKREEETKHNKRRRRRVLLSYPYIHMNSHLHVYCIWETAVDSTICFIPREEEEVAGRRRSIKEAAKYVI